MRVLLDECIDESLRHGFPGHDCQTCRYAGLKGLSNGKLLKAAEAAGFEVLITVDKNMSYQQSMTGRAISIVVLDGRTTNAEDLAILLPRVLEILEEIEPGQVVQVGRA